MRKKGGRVAHWQVWPTEGFTLLNVAHPFNINALEVVS